MIDYYYEIDFSLDKEVRYTDWLLRVLKSEKRIVNQLNYIFCDDNYLLELNVKHLNHNTLTDILTFDYSIDGDIVADIFISIERVKDNALDFDVDFNNELLRVMAHGVLHVVGYKDKSEGDIKQMREKEEEKIKMFHVEQ
ncbi:rRNA maturation RNase YbeY [Aurantibacter sp.]|uniref:rRNA maturation RNase YbeY n=1 Tax=Aurantibacter sp. TaxID=2807103 RepID=UPI00326712CA